MIGAVVLAAALAVSSGIDLGSSSRLYVHRDEGASVSVLQVVVKAGTLEQSANENGLAALAAESLLSTPVAGRPLADRVTDLGGSITVSVSQDVVRFSLEALPDRLPDVATAFATALRAAPTAEALTTARTDLGERINDDDRNPLAVGLQMVREATFSGSAAAPLLGTINNNLGLSVADVAAFRASHYRRAGVFVTAAGATDDSTTAAAKTVVDAFADGSAVVPTPILRPATGPGPRIVTHRDIGVPYVVLGYRAPAIGDRNFAAMLVLRSLLTDVSSGVSATTLPSFRRSVEVVYSYDMQPATFAVAVNGGLLDPTAGIGVVQSILKAASTKPLGKTVLNRYRTVAHGAWQLEAISFADRASLMSAALSRGVDPLAIDDVGAAIDRVTAADVMRAAKTYFARTTIALVLPRDAAH